MKKLIFLVPLLFAIHLCLAQKQPIISFDSLSYDFGKLYNESKLHTATFKFYNTGDAPLIIIYARTFCGCTTVSYPTKPIMPNEQECISVNYNPFGSNGVFDKRIMIKSNASNGIIHLRIYGTVKERPKKPQSHYMPLPMNMYNDLSLY